MKNALTYDWHKNDGSDTVIFEQNSISSSDIEFCSQAACYRKKTQPFCLLWNEGVSRKSFAAKSSVWTARFNQQHGFRCHCV